MKSKITTGLAIAACSALVAAPAASAKPVAKGKVTAPGQVCKTMKVKGKQSPEQRAAFKACIQAAVAAKKKPPVVVEPVPTEPAPTEPAPTV